MTAQHWLIQITPPIEELSEGTVSVGRCVCGWKTDSTGSKSALRQILEHCNCKPTTAYESAPAGHLDRDDRVSVPREALEIYLRTNDGLWHEVPPGWRAARAILLAALSEPEQP